MERSLVKETIEKINQKVLLKGWVATRRDHGKIIFLDLRDRSGLVQVVCSSPKVTKTTDQLKQECVVEIEGKVVKRPKEMINPDLETGKMEVTAEKIKILSKAKELPIPIKGDGYKIEENQRLKYRYLDLRRPRLQRNIRLRSKFIDYIRQYLFKNDFVEIETPLLTKSTPEGSRDFIVPSRLNPGKFYALPQSPQQYKQLLMVACFERYFQIARCVRDEDLRADRLFEHTQIDIEMSFVEREDVMNMAESLFIEVFEKMGAKLQKKPFPIFTYKEAFKKFGADKFDLRSKKEKEKGIIAFAWVVDFPVFEWDKEEQKWTYSHNPFTAPKKEYEKDLLAGKNIGSLVSQQYDLICNGHEVGGGGIRISKPEVLAKVFEILGHSKKEIQEKFGHMLEAFSYGVPPHGGIAPGIDRLLMVLLNEPALREVVAFPTTSSGQTAVMDAPSKLPPQQLKELGIKV